MQLAVDGTRARWVYRFTLGGRDREFGCGAYPETSLATARARRDDAREILRAGGDPIAERKGAAELQKTIPTFRAAALAYIEKHGSKWNPGAPRSMGGHDYGPILRIDRQ